MGILKKAENQQAFLKAGILGFAGSGKTYTAAMLSIAIAKRIGDKKPVAICDSEGGSDFLIDRFRAEGVELYQSKSAAFVDLLAAGVESEKLCSVLIVDSISHFWRELCETYQKQRKVSRLQFQHWADIKREWGRWTTFYLNSRIHIIVCGRAGFEYDYQPDEEGKKELIKVGTKMKVETEFGFEPSLLIEMERVAKGSKPGAGWIHRAHILKDRTDNINGMAFDFTKPAKKYKKADFEITLKPFVPVLESLNIGAEQVTVDASRTSEGLFDSSTGESKFAQLSKRKDTALDEIQGVLSYLWSGQDAVSKKTKLTVIEAVFNCFGWKAVEQMPVEELEQGLKYILTLKTDIETGLLIEKPEELKDIIRGYQKNLSDSNELPAEFAPSKEDLVLEN